MRKLIGIGALLTILASAVPVRAQTQVDAEGIAPIGVVDAGNPLLGGLYALVPAPTDGGYYDPEFSPFYGDNYGDLFVSDNSKSQYVSNQDVGPDAPRARWDTLNDTICAPLGSSVYDSYSVTLGQSATLWLIGSSSPNMTLSAYAIMSSTGQGQMSTHIPVITGQAPAHFTDVNNYDLGTSLSFPATSVPGIYNIVIPPGAYGEVCVQATSVTSGYVNGYLDSSGVGVDWPATWGKFNATTAAPPFANLEMALDGTTATTTRALTTEGGTNNLKTSLWGGAAEAQVGSNNSSAFGNGLTALIGIAETTSSSASYTAGAAAAPAIDLSGRLYLTGQSASGSLLSGNPIIIGGYDGTNAQWLRSQANNTAAGNALLVMNDRYDSTLPTVASGSVVMPEASPVGIQYEDPYMRTRVAAYSVAMFVQPASTAGVYALLVGSATTTVRINRITITGTQNTAGNIPITMQVRNASSGGTCSTATVGKNDQNSASATAVAKFCTSAVTTSTNLGGVADRWIYFPTTSGSGIVENNFNFLDTGPVVLRGTNQELDITFGTNNGTSGATGAMVTITWTEEAFYLSC